MTMRTPEGGHILLDPRFLIQVALLLLAAAGFAWKVQSETLANTREMIELKQDLREQLSEIKARLPNSEVVNYRFETLEKRVSTAEQIAERADGWVRVTREQMIAKGWRF